MINYFSENPKSPSLLDKLEDTLFAKLDRNESLKLLWTLPDKGISSWGMDSFFWSFWPNVLFLLLLECLDPRELEPFNGWPDWDCRGCIGELEPEVVGAWTSTLNFAVAVTFVICELGVEHRDEFPEFYKKHIVMKITKR